MLDSAIALRSSTLTQQFALEPDTTSCKELALITYVKASRKSKRTDFPDVNAGSIEAWANFISA